jgi:hypothetical protein
MNSKNVSVSERHNLSVYIHIIEIQKIDIDEVAEWKKNTEIERQELMNVIIRYNKLASDIRWVTEMNGKPYSQIGCDRWTIPMLKRAISHYGLTTEKFDDMEKELEIKTKKRVEDEKKYKEELLKKQKEQVILVDMLYSIDDEDLKRDMISEFVELVDKPCDGLRECYNNRMATTIQEQYEIWLTLTDEKKLTGARHALPHHTYEINKEIIERHYDSYARGYVMK